MSNNKKRGYLLLEVLVVLFIISVFAAIFLPAYIESHKLENKINKEMTSDRELISWIEKSIANNEIIPDDDGNIKYEIINETTEYMEVVAYITGNENEKINFTIEKK